MESVAGAEEVTARLQAALKAYKAGVRCNCSEPIWVIGSAETGHACFACITGESDPSEYYEIAEACDKHRDQERMPLRRGTDAGFEEKGKDHPCAKSGLSRR